MLAVHAVLRFRLRSQSPLALGGEEHWLQLARREPPPAGSCALPGWPSGARRPDIEGPTETARERGED
eukprot:8099193-Lingulodinium_polyedra.AAC.1